MDKKTAIILVVVVLLLCCCVVVGGVGFAFYANKNPLNITGTPAVRVTGAPIENATTEAPTPTIGSKKITTIYDTFDSNTNNWSLEKTESDLSIFDEYMKNGKLFFDVTAKEAVVVKDTLVSQPILNFDLSVDTEQISGATDADSAILFRRLDKNNYYLFSVCPDSQKYDLAVKKDGTWVELINRTKSIEINRTGSNTLRVVAADNKFSLYINGAFIEDITDETIKEPGLLGVAADLYTKDDKALFSFDNFDLVVKK